MKQINLSGWVLQVDTEATASYYETSLTDICDCAYCRNFLATIPEHFPKKFLEALEEMGIDPCKPFHISEVYRAKEHDHQYVGNYDFVGTVIQSPREYDPNRNFGLDILGKSPKLNIQFSVIVPWLLDEEPEVDSGAGYETMS